MLTRDGGQAVASPVVACSMPHYTREMAPSRLRSLGLRLAPLFHPAADDERRERKQLAEMLQAQHGALAAERTEVEALRKEVRRLIERLTRAEAALEAGFTSQQDVAKSLAADLRALQVEHAQGIRASLSKQGRFLKGILGSTRSISEQAVTQQRVLGRLSRIAAGTRPIIVGPWTGEVGFELIYWVPFVRWFLEHFAVDPARLVVVSRGGPVSWYGEMATRYVDVLELAGPQGLPPDGPTLKQRRLSARDRQLIRLASAQMDRVPSVLHPSYLYGMTASYLDGAVGVRPMLDLLRYRTITPPPRTLVPGLPAEYVAAKFYFSTAFPDTPENRRLAEDVLSRVAAGLPVVLLDHGLTLDNHSQYSDGRHHTLTSLGVTVTAANNLEIQTAVVGHARAFVGTYGGFAYLAPLCGVEAVVFHSVADFYLHHRHLADVAFARVHAAPLTVIPTHAAGLLNAGLRMASGLGAAHPG
jgi:hypothetical protein